MPHGTNGENDESGSLLYEACARLWRHFVAAVRDYTNAITTATAATSSTEPNSPSSPVPSTSNTNSPTLRCITNGHPPRPVLAHLAEELDAREEELNSRAAALEARERREGLLTTRVRRVCERERILGAAAAELEGRVLALEAREGQFVQHAEEQRQTLLAERQHFWALQRALSQVVANELEALAKEQEQLRADFISRARAAQAAVDAMRIAARQAAAAIADTGHVVPPNLRAAAQTVLDETADLNTGPSGAPSLRSPPLHPTDTANFGSCSSASTPPPSRAIPIPGRTYEASNGREETQGNTHAQAEAMEATVQTGASARASENSTARGIIGNANGAERILHEARSALKSALDATHNGEQSHQHSMAPNGESTPSLKP